MRNWAGNYEYRARTVHRPGSVEELQEIVSGASRIRALGSRHSFTDIGDADELVALDALPGEVEIGDGTVTVPAHLRYGDVAEQLEPAGLALHNPKMRSATSGRAIIRSSFLERAGGREGDSMMQQESVATFFA